MEFDEADGTKPATPATPTLDRVANVPGGLSENSRKVVAIAVKALAEACETAAREAVTQAKEAWLEHAQRTRDTAVQNAVEAERAMWQDSLEIARRRTDDLVRLLGRKRRQKNAGHPAIAARASDYSDDWSEK